MVMHRSCSCVVVVALSPPVCVSVLDLLAPRPTKGKAPRVVEHSEAVTGWHS